MADERDDRVLVRVGDRTLRISNLDKVLYPGTETTKGEVLHYYARVAEPLLRALAGRPVTRVRWPHGTAGPSFFEKNVPAGAPSWLPRTTITSRHGGKDESVTYPLVSDVAALTYLVNLASLELHVPQWRVDDGTPRAPDRLVIDLDPGPPAGLHECARLALVIKTECESAGFSNVVPVTSGSKGMQLYADLDGHTSSDEVREWARELAQGLTRAHPDLVVWKMTRSLRTGKILVDWSQNAASKTTICPYSLRGKDRPTAAAPRTWEEIENGAREPGRLRQLDLADVSERLDRHGDLLSP